MKKISTFALGLIVGVSLTAGGVVGAATYLQATPKTVKIVVGSNESSVEAMNVNSKLYVPVRDAASSFGYQVKDVTTSSVTFAEGKAVTTNPVGTGSSKGDSTTTQKGGEFIQGLHDKYSTNGKLDAAKVKAGIAAKEITVNAQDAESKNSLLHYVILEDNFAVYSVIKVNALDVNLQNSSKQTPLHLAVINENDFYFGELLTNYKADPTIKDKDSKRPIDYAKKGTSMYNGLLGYMM